MKISISCIDVWRILYGIISWLDVVAVATCACDRLTAAHERLSKFYQENIEYFCHCAEQWYPIL